MAVGRCTLPTLDGLPTEIIRIVAGYLHKWDLRCLSQVCKTLYQDITPKLYTRIDIGGDAKLRSFIQTLIAKPDLKRYPTHVVINKWNSSRGPGNHGTEGYPLIEDLLTPELTNLRCLSISQMYNNYASGPEDFEMDRFVAGVLAQPRLEHCV